MDADSPNDEIVFEKNVFEDDFSSDEDAEGFDSPDINLSVEDDTIKTADRFLVTLKYICGVNQFSMKIAIEETEKLISFVYDKTIKKIADLGCVLPEKVTSPAVKTQVCDVFKELKTNHRQKYFEKAYKVVEPKCVTISAKFKKVGERQRRTIIIMFLF